MDKYIECGTAIAKLTALEVINPNATMTDAKRLLADMPATDVAPVVHGRWIPAEYPFEDEYQDCSNCGYKAVWGFRYNYCPNCGAKMDGDGNG